MQTGHFALSANMRYTMAFDTSKAFAETKDGTSAYFTMCHLVSDNEDTDPHTVHFIIATIAFHTNSP